MSSPSTTVEHGMGAARETYGVVALFETLPVGTSFPRAAWPAHVTVASNFTVETTIDDVSEAIRAAEVLTDRLLVRFAAQAQFGPHRDIPVRLVESPRVLEMHERLSNRLGQLAGFTAEEPAYWRTGYRPHVTLAPGVSAQEGSHRVANCIAIARLQGDDAVVVAVFDLPIA